jgi:hypothetical protein
MNLEAGQEIDSQCLKCKGVTNHVIIAMADDQIAKVECKVCGAKHKYRPPKTEKSKPPKKKTSPKKTPRKTKNQLKAEAFYEEIMARVDPSTAVPYSMDDKFHKSQLIDHPKFGLGLVTSIVLPNKIKVAFKEGNKLLVCKLENPYAKRIGE